MTLRDPFRIIGLVFGTIGLGAAIGAAALYANTREFVSRAVRAEGEVVENVWGRGTSRSSGTAVPRVRFRGPHGPAEMLGKLGSKPPAYRVGEKVTVLYLPDAPDEARIESFGQLWFGPIFCSGFAVVFGGIGAGFLIVPALARRRRERARRFGQPVRARVTVIRLQTGTRVNGRSPWVIDASFEDVPLGKTYAFTSEEVWDDPTARFPVGSEVTVYYMPEEPGVYAFGLGEGGPGGSEG